MRLTLPPGTVVDVDVVTQGSWADAVAQPGLGSDLLEGLDVKGAGGFESWLLSEQQRLRAASEAVLHEAAQALLARQELGAALVCAQRAAHMSPLDENNQALLLHFWSPWSDESEAAMPDFSVTAKALDSNNIAVVSILPDDSVKALAAARTSLKQLGAKPPGAWLVDRPSPSLSRELRVQSLPTMVLVATDGRILFNGHPADDGLWQALQKINPAIHRPALAGDPHAP